MRHPVKVKVLFHKPETVQFGNQVFQSPLSNKAIKRMLLENKPDVHIKTRVSLEGLGTVDVTALAGTGLLYDGYIHVRKVLQTLNCKVLGVFCV